MSQQGEATPRHPTGGPREPRLTVTLDGGDRRLSTFVWQRRRWRVERVERTWVVETGWWDEALHVNRHYSRVIADGRMFDLFFDRITRSWHLTRAF